MSRRGFTLIETLVALAILSLVVLGLLASFMVQARSNSRSEQRTEAATAASQVIELLRLDDPELMPDSGTFGPQLVTLSERSYEVFTSYCTKSVYCGDTSRHLRVEVHLEGRRVYDVETIFTQLR